MRTTIKIFALSCFFCLFCSASAEDRYSTVSQKEEELISRVIQSLARADRMESKITDSILNLEGMSGSNFRHFINNLCSYPGTRYFEVGCWKGSTLVSAMYGNQESLVDIVACDNFSEFSGPKNEFLANIQTFAPNPHLRFFDSDCFVLNKAANFSAPMNVYFYDGAHTHKDQELAFTYFDSILDDVFIAIVDDWNLDAPRKGTALAFRKLGYKILFQATIDTQRNGNGNRDTWWNGTYVAVVKKKKVS